MDPLPTTAGSLALAKAYHEVDAPLVARLRAAGAVILGKTNLSEWANFRSAHSVSGWSGVGGQTLNPYATRFNPSGSSSGSAAAAAASLCAAAVGTETDGSILSPAAHCGLVGFKPTVGRVSGAGVVPLSPRQDTAGPLARSTRSMPRRCSRRWRSAAPTPRRRAPTWRLSASRDCASGSWLPPRRPIQRRCGYGPSGTSPSRPRARSLSKSIRPRPSPRWKTPSRSCSCGSSRPPSTTTSGASPGASRCKTLTDLIAFNRAHAAQELAVFGQDIFEDADKLGPITSPAYRLARDHLMNLAGTAGLATLFARQRVDVLVALGGGPAEPIDPVWGDRSDGGWPTIASAAAIAGYPSLTVPAGQVRALPVGVVFVAPRDHDAALLRVGHAYERATRARRPPTYMAG